MAKALLITRQDIVSQTVLNGNIDTDKFIQNVKYAQDAKLEPIIGEDLLAKIEADIIAGTLIDPYLSLVQNQIKDFLTYAAASDYIRLAAASVDNGGISKYFPNNGSTADLNEVLSLTTITENKAEFYGQRLIKFLKDNQASFPEYEPSQTKSYFIGWQLGTGCNGYDKDCYWFY